MARPLVPEDLGRNGRGRRSYTSLARACLATARAKLEPNGSPARIAERSFARDEEAGLILRAATSPTSTTSEPELLQALIADVLLGATGAAGQLLARALRLDFGRNWTVSLPTLITDPNHAAWVTEAAAIPFAAPAIPTPQAMTPHKLMALLSVSQELLDSSNAEALMSELLRRSIGLRLDATLFDANAGDAARPAGLRNGITALTASSNTVANEAALEDIGTLLEAVEPIGGEVVFIASATRGRMLAARSGGGTLPPVLGSPGVNADDLIAVATDAIVSATSGELELRASKEASLQMQTTPTSDLMTGAPVASMFQTGNIALRARLGISWARRDVRAVAWLTTGWK
jgi:hypothetical protein